MRLLNKTFNAAIIACGLASTIALAQVQTKADEPLDSQNAAPTQSQYPAQSSSPPGSQDGAQALPQAQDQVKDAAPPMSASAPAPMTEVVPKTENGVTYLCGGVGKDEAQAMKQSARAYDLMLTFVTRKGEYLADVTVEIKDAGGNAILTTICDAPILLVDFPSTGTYRIRAETNGYALNRMAQIKAKRRGIAVVLQWPPQVAEIENTLRIANH